MTNNFKIASFTVGNGAWQSNPLPVTVSSRVTWMASPGFVGIMTPVNPGVKAWRDMFAEIRALEETKKEAP